VTIWANEKLKKIAKKKGGSSLSHHLISKACAGSRDLLMRQPGVAFLVLLFLPLLLVNDGYAQGVLVGPDGKTSTQVLSLPYGFYNENFGFAAGYVYGVTGYPQEQSALLTTAIVGSRGSGMLFLLGRDIRMPGTRRLFFDPVASVGYFGENEAYIDGNPSFATSAPAATTRMRKTSSRARAGTTSSGSGSNMCCPSAPAKTRLSAPFASIGGF